MFATDVTEGAKGLRLHTRSGACSISAAAMPSCFSFRMHRLASNAVCSSRGMWTKSAGGKGRPGLSSMLGGIAMI